MDLETKINFVFFGSDSFSVTVLEELEKEGFLPAVVVTPPDKPAGRGLNLSVPPTKSWAVERKIEVLQPEKLDADFANKLKAPPAQAGISYKLFVVASYGKIIPKEILDIPEKGVLNVHPSLLPKYRGPSPIESQILNDEKEVGVSIMLLDEKVDHGPVLGEKRLVQNAMPMPAPVLLKTLAALGGRLLASIIPKWLSGELVPVPQDESKATFTKKIGKEEGLIDLAGNPRQNYLKFLALSASPGVYFFTEREGLPAQAGKKIRVLVRAARFENDKFTPLFVIPEGRREMNYEDFLRG